MMLCPQRAPQGPAAATQKSEVIAVMAKCQLLSVATGKYSFPFASADFPKLITWTVRKVFRTDLPL